MQQLLETAKIVAYLPGINGAELIVERMERSDENRYAFLLPPDYVVMGQCAFPMVQSAIAKHSYIPETKRVIVRNHTELKQYIASRDAQSQEAA